MAHDMTAHTTPPARSCLARPRDLQASMVALMRAAGKPLVAHRGQHAQAALMLYGIKIESLRQKDAYEMDEFL